MPIKQLPNGRYQAIVQNKRRGIARTRRTFDTRKQAADWKRAVENDAHNILLGHQRRRLFGEALAKYLREESPKKRTTKDDEYNANALRWPVWNPEHRRWIWLELTPLDDIVPALKLWEADMAQVTQRRYLAARLYQKRSAEWWYQPHPSEGETPRPRERVTEPALLAQLETGKGRGPFSADTIRVRLTLASTVLNYVWDVLNTKNDRWLSEKLGEKVRKPPKPRGRHIYAPRNESLALIIAAPIHFDDAIFAACECGWRKGVLLGSDYKARALKIEGLTWDRVLFPVHETDPLTGARRCVQDGMFWTFGPKNGKPQGYPMTTTLEQLFRHRWDLRNGPYVFHRGDGRPWGEPRKVWKRTKKEAGVREDFRWHDLRHTWASYRLQEDRLSDGELQALGNWSDRKMVANYGHLRMAHLLTALEPNRK